MQYYTGTATVKALYMSSHDYQAYREYTPTGKNEPGYLVEILGDYGKNHPQHEYRITWMARDYFEQHYGNHAKMNFSQALFLLNQGAKLTRASWKDVKVYIQKQESNQFITEPCLFLTINEQVTPWFGTNRDYFAEDWMVVQ